MALRDIRAQITVEIDPRRDFQATIPEGFLEHEPDPDKIERLWESFRSSVNRQCKGRQAFLQNKHYKKFVFNTGMEKLCKDFSRQTESVKVAFEMQTNGKEKTFLLKIVKLNAIPDSCRNVQFCTAEIPPPEMQAYAEFVSFNDDNMGGRVVDQVVQVSTLFDNAAVIAGAEVTTLSEPSLPVSSAPFTGAVAAGQQQDTNYDTLANPPVAMAVAETVSQPPQEAVIDQRSALERMQELETIKSFLSESEFAAKRQAILRSI